MESAATTQQAADALLLAVRPRQGCWSENDYLWLTDHCTRLVELADGRIAEYWIVDPERATITVLSLRGHEYSEHGLFASGEVATSPLLEGFGVDVAAAFDDPSARRG
ncbi:MAG: Uma2 family endonuclease [Gammaproteobacteria bacterium]|nr:Uma2 family endonuclease [Gammaproteobacteria bacterium]